MKGLRRFYMWGRDMKYRMGLYTVAAIWFKGIVNALNGVYSIESLTLLEMVLVSMAFACVETAIFPQGKQWGLTPWRTGLWAVLANVFLHWERLPLWLVCGDSRLGRMAPGGAAGGWFVCHVVRIAAGNPSGYQGLKPQPERISRGINPTPSQAVAAKAFSLFP